MAAKSIAVIIGSTRPGRVNPSIAKYVLDIITTAHKSDASSYGGARFELVDIAEHDLPLFAEPVVPARLPKDDPTPHYALAATRAWSLRMRQYDAFVFVTPQYNWSVPASLKNALDHLFHEWTGKPAGIVTYGGHGGGKAAAHLRQILAGLRMGSVAEPSVELHLIFPGPELGPAEVEAAMRELWHKNGDDQKISAMAGSLVKLLSS
ncbi:flavoprotein-like protein [Xylariomycetidae sp. FL2044]|nr:flavoprotein-like protein [Xylariomycetidae sp. FL2044]